MAHDVPLGCAPDEYDDLISGTCSHLPKTCWRTNFFKPLLKRSDAVVAVKKWLKPERVKFARGEP
ncbi:hypothetical protein ACP8VM_18900 [Klebsiella pneumoniae]